MEFTVRGFTFVLSILITFTQETDIAPGVYCNKKSLAWPNARNACIGVNGHFVAYNTGLGVPVANLNLNSKADVWTADYAYNVSNERNDENALVLCGFYYLTRDTPYSPVMYGNCNAKRHYICRNDTDHKLYVLTGTRNSIHCSGVFSSSQYRQIIIPGYYWEKDNITVIPRIVEETTPAYFEPYLCGAYSAAVGKYFVDCTMGRSSLCYTDHTISSFDKSCFVHGSASSTVKPASQTTLSVSKSLRTARSTLKTTPHNTLLTTNSSSTTIQPIATHKQNSLKTAATPVETIETHSANAIAKATTRPKPTVTPYSWTKVSDHGKVGKSEGKDQNIGLSVGLPVGLCIALICGITLSIYLLRRYKCWKTQGRKEGAKHIVSWNNVSSTRQDVSRYNKHSEKHAVNIFDQTATDEKPTQKNENVYTDSLPEYAVVTKNDLKQMSRYQKENSPSKEKKTGSVHNSEMDGNSSYCYAEFGNKNNQLANSNGIQTSEYSFAKETPEDMDDIGEKQAAVKEDEYDVTSGKPSNKTSYNIYNKLQKENYYSDTNERGGNSRNQESESVYDSANQSCPSGPTDNIYNHLSQDDTYSDVSTRNEDKIQQSKLTDQTYDKLK